MIQPQARFGVATPEAFDLDVPWRGVDVDAEFGGVFDDLVLVAGAAA
ncbi:hypothetical protein [Streptomyces sp. AB3(2024)]